MDALRKRLSSFSSLGFRLSLFLATLGTLVFPTRAFPRAEDIAPPSILQSVEYVSAEEYTRVTLTFSEEVRHKISTEPATRKGSPSRLVVDFSPAKAGLGAPRALAVHDGFLKHVQTRQSSASSVQAILEVENVKGYNTFELYGPYRLVLDVRGKIKRPAPPVPVVDSSPAPIRTRQALATQQESSRGGKTAAVLQSARRRAPIIVMLDPGHGGKDPGAMSEDRVLEKDVVLAISKRLGKKLSTRLAVKVMYTRSSDVYIPLDKRVARANRARADFFVSIHANASTSAETQGVETYYLNNTNDRATIRLAALENGGQSRRGNMRSDGKSGLSYVLSDLIQNGKAEESVALARHLQTAVVTRAREKYPAVRNLGVKKGPFYVLVGAHMPCVLVETAFLTHRAEGKFLADPQYQDALAEGLFLGLFRFLRSERRESNL
ncbi:MAG: N-acetylmuramoyl-L-alanine amidase [Deltaproteobacteria bacterium]|nr:N-acetylmuramoyl-L-alanine amidase [Deltaproteobacteria bacterium]